MGAGGVSLISIPGKGKKQLILGIISRQVKEKLIAGSSQHGFVKGKSRLANLASFYGKMTGLMDRAGSSRCCPPGFW